MPCPKNGARAIGLLGDGEGPPGHDDEDEGLAGPCERLDEGALGARQIEERAAVCFTREDHLLADKREHYVGASSRLDCCGEAARVRVATGL